MSAAARSARSRARSLLPLVLLVVAGVLVVLVAGAPSNDGPPLDPSSTGQLGTRALVLLLEREGARVDVSGDVPTDPAAGALVLVDDLGTAQHDAIESWVRAGGTLVVADPRSPLSDVAGLHQAGEQPLQRGCGLRALTEARRIEAPGGVLSRVPPGAVGCYGTRDGSYLVARPEGRGTVVTLGGAGPLVNANLGKADNSVLIASLLAPRTGARVTILRPPPVGGGRKSLVELVPRRLRAAGIGLLAAFVVACLWRARRLGRPVPEPLPVRLPGSELVVAVGNLWQQAGRRDRAGDILRHDLRRTLAERLSLGRDAAPEVVAEVAASRTGLDRQRILAALTAPVPPSDATLVALAQFTEAVRQEVAHAR